MCIICLLNLGWHHQEKDNCRAQKQSRADIEYRLQSRILLVRRRHNDIIILHLAVGKCVFQLSPLDIRLAGMFLNNLHIPVRLGIVFINLEYLIQGFARFRIILMTNMQKSQQKMCFYKSRIGFYNSCKL